MLLGIVKVAVLVVGTPRAVPITLASRFPGSVTVSKKSLTVSRPVICSVKKHPPRFESEQFGSKSPTGLALSFPKLLSAATIDWTPPEGFQLPSLGPMRTSQSSMQPTYAEGLGSPCAQLSFDNSNWNPPLLNPCEVTRIKSRSRQGRVWLPVFCATQPMPY